MKTVVFENFAKNFGILIKNFMKAEATGKCVILQQS